MAKKQAAERVVRRVTTVEERGEPAPPTGDELDVTDPETPDTEEMDAIGKLHELSGGNVAAMYEVRRVLPSADAGYCGTLSHEEMTMERIVEEWGAGSYTVRVRLPGGRYAGSSRVQIAPLPKHKQPPPVASQPQPSSGTSELATVLTAMQKNTDAQISMLSGLVNSLIARPLPTPPPPPDTLAILATVKELFKPEKKEDGMDMFLKGLEFGKELGGGGGETDFGSLLVKGIEGLKDLSASQPAPAPAPHTSRARPALAAPGTVPAKETPAQAAPVVQEGAPPMLQLLQWLRQQTVMLCHQASKGKDPGLYAELFLDNLPPGLTPEIMLERLQAPDAIQQLGRLNSNVLKFPEWFEEFRQECIDALTDDGDQAGGDDGPAIEGGPGVEIIGGGNPEG